MKLRIAKTGKSIRNGDKDQVFDTNFPVFNIVKEDIVYGNQTITNDLGIPTAFLCWTRNGWKANSWILHKDATMSNATGALTTNTPGVFCKYILTQRKLVSTHTAVRPVGLSPALVVADNDDVKTASWSRIKFHSAKGTLQVWFRQTVAVNYMSNNVWVEVTIPHGLGFTPAFMAYAFPTSVGAWGLANTICNFYGIAVYGAGGRYTEHFTYEACADDNNIYVRCIGEVYDVYGMEGNNRITNWGLTAQFDIIIIGAIT